MPAKCKRRVKVDDVKVVEEYDLDLGPAQRTVALEAARRLEKSRPARARSIRYWVGRLSSVLEIRQRIGLVSTESDPLAHPPKVAKAAAAEREKWSDHKGVLMDAAPSNDGPGDDGPGIRVVPSRYQPE